MASRTPNVLLSASNELDNLARYVHRVEVIRQQQQQQQLMQLTDNVVKVQNSPGGDFDELPEEPNDDLL